MTRHPHRHSIPLQIEVLTPVAAGSGQTLDPMRYALSHEQGRHVLHFLDLDDWVDSKADNPQFLKLLEGSPLELRSFLHDDLQDQTRLRQFSIGQRRVEDAGLVKKFQQELARSDSRNRLQVAEAIKNPLTRRLLLPGSSLKGALVTPILDHLERKHRLNWKQQRNPKFSYRGLVEASFGKITDSAFRALKVGDSECPAGAGEVVTAIEKRKSKEEDGTPKLPTEAIGSTLMDGKTPLHLHASLVLGFDDKSSGVLGIPKLKEKLDWKDLCRIATKFYRDRFEEEWQQFYTKPWMQHTASALLPIRQRIAQVDPEQGALLLRVGHYSHSRCVTIENSVPWAMERRIAGETVRFGPNTTRTLANGVLPFGWVILRECDWSELEQHRRQLDSEWQHEQSEQQDLRKQLDEQRCAAEAAEQARQAELLRKAKETARREAEEAAKLKGERLLPEVAKLANWGDLRQFAERELAALDPQEYVPALGEALRKQVESKGVSKQKLKKEPDLLEKRRAQVKGWLRPFEERS